MSMAFPTASAGLQRVLAASVAGIAALLLSGCVNTRTTTTSLDSASSPSGAQLVTESDESNARRRARLRMELAAGYFEHGQNTVALDEIKQALNADPNYADAFALRGLVYMRMEDAGLAEDSFRRALALNPRDGNTRHNYGWLLCQQNRYRDAAQQFTEALATPAYTERAKTLMTQGLCEMRAGQPVEAERSLQAAYEIDAGNPVVGFNLASLLAKRGGMVARAVLRAPRQQRSLGQRRNPVAGDQDRAQSQQPRGGRAAGRAAAAPLPAVARSFGVRAREFQ